MSKRSPLLRVSLKTFLLGLSVVVLVLPIAGIQIMRIYESALVRQTESALIAQAAFIGAMYRTLVIEQGTQDWESLSRAIPASSLSDEASSLPRPPELDLATSPILPPLADGLTDSVAHPYAAKVGERLDPVLKDAQLTTLAGIRVVDPWGVIIATTGEDLGHDISLGEEINAALHGVSLSRIRQKTDLVNVTAADSLSRTSKLRVFVASPIILYDRLVGAVLLSRTPPSIWQALYGKRWLLAQAGVYLLIIAVGMALVTYRVMARPIQRLAQQAQQISAGEVSGMAHINQHQSPRVKEVAQLQEAIVDMATSLEARATYLQDFARHISHEFKTPLASIRGAIEVLQDHRQDMTDAQYTHFVQNITSDTNRLQQLTERLNELAQADLGSSELAQYTLFELCESLQHSFPNIRILLGESLQETKVTADAEAYTAALEVLVENAIQHGADEVHINATEEGKVTISNNGEAISAGNAARIFDPFFTTRRDHGGTGLGLPIARALLARSNATLSLMHAAQPTTFAISM